MFSLGKDLLKNTNTIGHTTYLYFEDILVLLIITEKRIENILRYGFIVKCTEPMYTYLI